MPLNRVGGSNQTADTDTDTDSTDTEAATSQAIPDDVSVERAAARRRQRREPEDSISERNSSSESDPMTDVGDTTAGGGQPGSGPGGVAKVGEDGTTTVGDTTSGGSNGGGGGTSTNIPAGTGGGYTPVGQSGVTDPGDVPTTDGTDGTGGGGGPPVGGPTGTVLKPDGTFGSPTSGPPTTPGTTPDPGSGTGGYTPVETGGPNGTATGTDPSSVEAAPTQSEFDSSSEFVEASAEYQFGSVDEGEIYTVQEGLRPEARFTERGASQLVANYLGEGVTASDVSLGESEGALGYTITDINQAIRGQRIELREDVSARGDTDLSSFVNEDGTVDLAEARQETGDDVRLSTFVTGEEIRRFEAGQESRQEALEEAQRRQENLQAAFARGNYGDPREIREEEAARQVSDQLGFDVTDEDLALTQTDDGQTRVELSDQTQRAATLSTSAEFFRRDATIERTDAGDYRVELPSDSDTAQEVEDALTQKVQTGEAFGGETTVDVFGHTLNVEQYYEDIADWTNKNVAQPTGQFIDDANLFRKTQPAFTGGDSDQELTGSPSVGEASEDLFVQTTESTVNLVGEAPKELLETGETAFSPAAWEIAGSGIIESGQFIVRNPNAELISPEDTRNAVSGTIETGERVNRLAQANPEAAASVTAGLLGAGAVTAGTAVAAPTAISRLATVAPRTARTVEFAFDPVRTSARAADTATTRARSAIGNLDVSPRNIGPDVSVVRDPDSGVIDVTPEARQEIRQGISSRVPSREGVRSGLADRIQTTRERTGAQLARAELQRRVAAKAVRDMSVDDAIEAGRTAGRAGARRARDASADRLPSPSGLLGSVPDSPTVRLDIGEPSAAPSTPLGSGDPSVQSITEYEGARGASGAFSAQVFDDPYSGLVDANLNANLRAPDRPSLPSLPDSPTVRFDIGEPATLPSRTLGGESRVLTATEYEGARDASGAFSVQAFDDPYSGRVDVNVNTRPREAARAFAETSFERFQSAGRGRAERNAEVLSDIRGAAASRLPTVRDRVPSNPTFRFDIGAPDSTPSQTLSGESIEQTRTEYVGDRRASGPYSVQAIGDAETGLVDVNVNTGPREGVRRATDAVAGLRDLTVRVEPSRPPRTPMTQTVDADDIELTADERDVFTAFDDAGGDDAATGNPVLEPVDDSDGAVGQGAVESGSGQLAETRVGVTAPRQDAGPNAGFRGIIELEDSSATTPLVDRASTDAVDVQDDLLDATLESSVAGEQTPVAADAMLGEVDAPAQEALETGGVELAPVVGQPVGTGVFQGPTTEPTPGVVETTIGEPGVTTRPGPSGRGRPPRDFPGLDFPDSEDELARGPVFDESRRQYEEELLDPLATGGDSDSSSSEPALGGFL